MGWREFMEAVSDSLAGHQPRPVEMLEETGDPCASPGCPGFDPDGLGGETCMHCGDEFCGMCAMHARDDALGVEPGGESLDIILQIGASPMSACDACHNIACRRCATHQTSTAGPNAFFFMFCTECGQKKSCMSCAFGDTPGIDRPFLLPCMGRGPEFPHGNRCTNTLCWDCYERFIFTLHVEEGMSMEEAIQAPLLCGTCFAAEAAADQNLEPDSEEEEEEEESLTKADVKKMTVVQLREQLEQRDLSTKGLKAALQTRLLAAL